jgi:hypothetical protein
MLKQVSPFLVVKRVQTAMNHHHELLTNRIKNLYLQFEND